MIDPYIQAEVLLATPLDWAAAAAMVLIFIGLFAYLKAIGDE